METKDINQTSLYNFLKYSIRQTLIEHNKDLSIVENHIKDNLMKDDIIQEVIRKYSSPIALTHNVDRRG